MDGDEREEDEEDLAVGAATFSPAAGGGEGLAEAARPAWGGDGTGRGGEHEAEARRWRPASRDAGERRRRLVAGGRRAASGGCAVTARCCSASRGLAGVQECGHRWLGRRGQRICDSVIGPGRIP